MAVAFGITPAFVGFIVVELVGGAAEMASAFADARKNRIEHWTIRMVVGVLVLMVCLIFAMTLYLLPPGAQ
jgi:Ca2+:H+ antiporter